RGRGGGAGRWRARLRAGPTGRARLLVACPEEARQGQRGIAGQEASVVEEALRLVERLQRALGDETALALAPLQELLEHARILAEGWPGLRSSRSGTSCSPETSRTRTAAGWRGGSRRWAWRSS